MSSHSLDSKFGEGKKDTYIHIERFGTWNGLSCSYSSFFFFLEKLHSIFPSITYRALLLSAGSEVCFWDLIHRSQTWSLKFFADQFLISRGVPQGISIGTLPALMVSLQTPRLYSIWGNFSSLISWYLCLHLCLLQEFSPRIESVVELLLKHRFHFEISDCLR